jgi:ferritin-like metal-binding protein YciE
MATKKSQQKQKSATLQDLFILKLNSLYYVENKLLKALPKMAKAATDPMLREAFTQHLAETETHVTRIEKAMESIDKKAKKESVSAIDGMIEDAEWLIKNIKEREARDASLIAAAQYVENYEKAGYATAIEWARTLGHASAEELLTETLAEEKAADQKLTILAESGINEAANLAEIVIVM